MRSWGRRWYRRHALTWSWGRRLGAVVLAGPDNDGSLADLAVLAIGRALEVAAVVRVLVPHDGDAVGCPWGEKGARHHRNRVRETAIDGQASREHGAGVAGERERRRRRRRERVERTRSSGR